jgi:hypothetical protein
LQTPVKPAPGLFLSGDTAGWFGVWSIFSAAEVNVDGSRRSYQPEVYMRKLIMMAVAGFIWKKI